MVLGFLAVIGSGLASGVIIDSVTAGVGLGISVYTASKCVKQSGRTRRRRR